MANRLARADAASFVGRRRERELFRSALSGKEPAFSVLLLHGPGGVGKTTLLRELAREARAAGRPVLTLDARDLAPTRGDVMRAVAEMLGAPDGVDPGELPFPPRAVLFVDTFETISALDTWVRDTLLPALPDDLLVVIAGRQAPALPWRTDGRWSRLARSVELKNFEPDESAAFLASRGVEGAADAGVLEFTSGHPLALALVAGVLAQRPDRPQFDPADSPDVVAHLLELLLQDVPHAMYRQALEICALARTTTERLLVEMLGDAEGARAFAWLRQQPYIESGPFGLFPHDLVRELLVADAQWRDSASALGRARRVYGILHSHIAAAQGAERQRLLMDALYVTRTKPTNRRFFDWSALDQVRAEPMDASDASWAFAVIARHEGAASAEIARAWWKAQPSAFHVFRDAREERFGFLVMLDLADTNVRRVTDAAVSAALDFIERHGPVQAGDGAVYLRWWMHAESYQAVTAAINLTAMHVVSHCMTRPRVAWSFVSMADPDFWMTHFAGVNFARVPGADFEVGRRGYGVFAHDWRVEPPADWATGAATPMPFAGAVPVTPPLDEKAFRNAVRQALRAYTRPTALLDNPLRTARCVAGGSGDPASPAAIQRTMREVVDALKSNPRDAKLHRAIWLTYFEPLATQEAVAERLGLPFSTYRHHLGRAIDHVADALWRLERLGRKLSVPGLPD
jgi:hypothetical protein